MTAILIVLLSFAQAYAQFGSATTIEDVENFVHERKLKSVEDFLDALDDEQKKRYVLMYDSKSLQGATFQKPRVIMFSKTAEILFSFNGDNGQKNGNKIEMILFDKKNSRFRAHEIEFTGKEAIVKKDPQVCMSCHGTDLRPNWNHYNFWEGAYGSDDAVLSKLEHRQLKRFQRKYDSHPRYRHLGDVRERFEVKGKIGIDRMNNLDIFDLTQKVLYLNFYRIRRIVKANDQYEKIKYPLISLFGMCDPEVYKSVLPEGYFERIHPGFVPMDVKYDFQREDENDLKRLQLLQSVGIDTEFLTTTFGNTTPPASSPGMDFKSKFTTPGGYQAEFTYIMTHDDPDLLPFTTPLKGGSFMGAKYPGGFRIKCDEFKNLSTRVTGLKLVTDKPTVNPGKEVFDRTCLKCHKTDALTGYAFSEKELSSELKSRPELIESFRYRLDAATDASERMPLGKEISSEERRAVQDYIESLLN